MIVNSITNYGFNNNSHTSFKSLKVKPECMQYIKSRVPKETVEQLEEIMKKPINVKQVLSYDMMPKGSAVKYIADKVLSDMPEEEVNDLTVEITDIGRYNFSSGSYIASEDLSEEDEPFNGVLLDNDIIKLTLETPEYFVGKFCKKPLFATDGSLGVRQLTDYKFISDILPIPSSEFIEERIQDEFRKFANFKINKYCK